MKQFWLLVLMVVFCGATWAQETKPPFTAEQCRAMKKVLLSKVGAGDSDTSVVFKELLSSLVDMNVCEKIDTQRKVQYEKDRGGNCCCAGSENGTLP